MAVAFPLQLTMQQTGLEKRQIRLTVFGALGWGQNIVSIILQPLLLSPDQRLKRFLWDVELRLDLRRLCCEGIAHLAATAFYEVTSDTVDTLCFASRVRKTTDEPSLEQYKAVTVEGHSL